MISEFMDLIQKRKDFWILPGAFLAFKMRIEGLPGGVTQRLVICLPGQGTRVPSLVWKDSTCQGAAEPVCCSY